MGDPNAPELQRAEILEALHRHGVEFLMVGGQAASAYGAKRLTHDLDVVVRWSPENLDRMGEVLVELNAGARIEGMAEPFAVPHRDGRFLAGMELSTWRSPMGDVDVLRGLPSPHGEVRYDDLLDRAETFRIDGHAVKVASLDDVIVSKQTTNRPSDIAALPELVAIAGRRPTMAQPDLGGLRPGPQGPTSTLDPGLRPPVQGGPGAGYDR
jgi:hypothetical protein